MKKHCKKRCFVLDCSKLLLFVHSLSHIYRKREATFQAYSALLNYYCNSYSNNYSCNTRARMSILLLYIFDNGSRNQ